MLHLMRSITPPPDEVADVEAILTEVGGWVGELRCASMGRLVQGQVSMSQMHVLWLLQHHGELSMSRLAELLGVSLSNATGIIDRMEEHGFIERGRVPDDRRVVHVRPAPAGLRALSETESTKRDRMRAVVRHIPAAERPTVLAALRTLRRALSVEVESSPVHEHHFADLAN
jgi:DNA-binding MarR family transcriptional regulator